MQLKRKQTLRAGAGLLTAMSMLILGCNPASFTPGQNGNPAAPSQPGAQPLVYSTLSGQATLKGQPLKNATITVVDAVKGQSASIISAGGGNIISAGGGNLTVKDAGLKTDANGNFNLQLAGLSPQSVAKVVITGEGKTLSALVSGSGKVLGKQYAVLRHGGDHVAAGSPGTIGGPPAARRDDPTAIVAVAGADAPDNSPIGRALTVDERSSILAAIAEPMLNVTGVLTDSAAQSARQTMLDEVNALIEEIEQQIAENPGLIDEIITTPATPAQPNPGGPATPAVRPSVNLVALNSMLNGNASISAKITATVQKTVAAVATLAADSANRQTTADTAATLGGTNFVGTKIEVSVTGSTVKIGDTTIETSPPTTTDPDTSTDPTDPTDSPEDPVESPLIVEETVVEPESTDGTIKSDANAFDPALTFTTTSIKVVQGQGQEDVKSVYARMLKTDVNAPASWTNAIVANTSTANLSGTVKAVSLANTTAAVPSLTLHSHLGSIAVSGSNDVYHGHLVVGGTQVATFTVYDDGTYYVLGLVYTLTDAVKINGGHTTTLNLAGTSLKAGKEVKYVLYSRGTNTVQSKTTIPTP